MKVWLPFLSFGCLAMIAASSAAETTLTAGAGACAAQSEKVSAATKLITAIIRILSPLVAWIAAASATLRRVLQRFVLIETGVHFELDAHLADVRGRLHR